MTTHPQLNDYLGRIKKRLATITGLWLLLLVVAVALLVTLLAGWALPRLAFSNNSVLFGRIALGVALLAVAYWGWRRYQGLSHNHGADALEAVLPLQNGRVRTLLDEQRKNSGSESPLLQLLGEDAWQVAQQEPLTQVLPTSRMLAPLALAVVALAGLLALLGTANPLAAGAQRLWGAAPPATLSAAVAAGGIAVKPGDVAVRRNQDLNLAALVAGAAGSVQVHVQFADTPKWETATMERNANGEYQFTLYAVREAARYYVSAGSLRSKEFQVSVVDLPQIESMRLTYDYPRWTGLPRRTEESGADISAVAGTQVALEIKTDKPMEGPLLIVDGTQSGLTQNGTVSRGRLAVQKEGVYRIATRFGNEIVPLTEDFQITLIPDEKPTVEILRPGRDYKATNLEEVPVGVKAEDDFRLESVDLQYSVNGGPWRSEKLGSAVTDLRAAALLRLEEMQQAGKNGEGPLLVPGDLVSYYAVARDHSNTVQTDLFLIQVQPFDLRFSQSQANSAGGGGGEEEDEGAISQRQREVLLATWNLARNKPDSGGREAERDADSARMLAEVQKTLADQANTLVQRAGARMLTGVDENVTAFVKSLEEAAKAMKPAAESLEKQNLTVAIQHEQQALQHLLRAEATFRDIQVSMQGRNGSAGGGSQAGRDVSEMTELELDLEKNQYETEPQMTAQQKDKAQDEALQRLRELARRQEQLAKEAARQRDTPEAQRWQQEQLRREAEQLRQALEQMAQQRGSGSSQSGEPSQSSDASGAAADRVAEAMRQMQARNSAAGAARAGEELRRAREQLERGKQEADRERFSNLAEQARGLVDRQRETEQELRAAVLNRPPPSIANPRTQQGSGMSFEQMQRLAESKREIQSSLEDLQRRMRSAQRQAEQEAPRATQRLEEAATELEESGMIAGLARSAREIERGRGAQAATREGLITEAMESLQRNLDEAASVAAGESGSQGGQQGRGSAEPGDLLAELGDLRRALQNAQAQGNQGGGQAQTAGTQQGPGGGRIGGRLAITDGGRDRPLAQAGLSAQRLQQLREQLRNGALAEADLNALQELSRRLRRSDGDPMVAERARLLSLVNQLELAALRATQAGKSDSPTRAADVVDDSARYRDNVADYYRRLGSAND